MPDRLEIQIDEEGRGVSAEALRSLLDQALQFLMSDPDDGPGVTWKVTQLSMNSPLTMRLEREVAEGEAEPASRPAEQMMRSFGGFERGELPGDELQPRQLNAIAKLASSATSYRSVQVKADRGNAVRLQPQWASDVRKLIAERKREAKTPDQPYSVSGRLEGVDMHGAKSEFYVYDPLTDQKMRCIFPEAMLDEVAAALGGRVTVSGVTTFGAGNQPQSMRVSRLKRIVTREGSFLERLAEAHRRGEIDLTGGLSAEDAIDEVRDAAG